MQVSKAYGHAPQAFETPLQRQVYETLAKLDMPFLLVGSEMCIRDSIDRELQVQTVKTLFLCNRQQTEYYLFITPGDKSFRTRDVSHALGVSRLSFAPAECLPQKLGTILGATTVFSVLLDTARDVTLVFDRQAIETRWYGCTDGTTTGYMKVRTDQLLQRFLPCAGHGLSLIHI